MFWDSEPLWHHFRAGAALGPVGNGRTTLTAGSLTNPFGGIVNLSTGTPLNIGEPLPLNTLTNMTLGQFIQIYNQQIGSLNHAIGADPPPTSGPISVSGIDVATAGIETSHARLQDHEKLPDLPRRTARSRTQHAGASRLGAAEV